MVANLQTKSFEVNFTNFSNVQLVNKPINLLKSNP